MEKYNVHAGHNKKVPGASKYLNEVTENRKVKDYLIKYLKDAGNTVWDCTDDFGNTQNANLQNIVAKCNNHAVTLDISIHLNAGGGTGVEVYNYDERTKNVSDKICYNVSKALGISNRGTKYSKSLYVLNNTKSLAILIECCFVDSKTDKEKWDAQKCAKAIAEAITGKSITTSSKPTTSKKKTTDEIAKEVIAGEWGNGDTRKKKLKAAGYDYAAVQNRVNQLLVAKTTSNYYKKFNSTSIVDGLKSIGVDSIFSNRKKIAKANGISVYLGTSSQNKKLLSLAKAGKLKKA